MKDDEHLADGMRLDRKITAKLADLGNDPSLAACLDAAEDCLARIRRSGDAEERLIAAAVLERLDLTMCHMLRNDYLRHRDGNEHYVQRYIPGQHEAQRQRLATALREMVQKERGYNGQM